MTLCAALCHMACRSARTALLPAQALRVVSALAPAPLLQLLAQRYVAAKDAQYGCRVLAVQLMGEMLTVLRSAGLVGEQVATSLTIHSCQPGPRH